MSDPLDYVDNININTKNFPPVAHLIEVAPHTGEKLVRICRCWQSKKFPYCDDTHKVLVEAGDNVGPYVARIKGYGTSIEQKAVSTSTTSTVMNNPLKFVAKRKFPLAIALVISGVVNYYASNLLKRWTNKDSRHMFLDKLFLRSF